MNRNPHGITAVIHSANMIDTSVDCYLMLLELLGESLLFPAYLRQ
jgi:hypothetical protein